MSEQNDWRITLGNASLIDQLEQQSVNNKVTFKVAELKDPATSESRDYMLLNDGSASNDSNNANKRSIVEFQCISNDFAAYIHERRVIGDSNLYVMNKVDPLYFVLAANETPAANFQPYDQLVCNLPDHVQHAVAQEQLKHLCQIFCNDQTLYFKFCDDRAMRWLQRKQECVEATLVRQRKRSVAQARHREKHLKTICGGSRSLTFFNPDDEQDDANDAPANEKTENQKKGDSSNEEEKASHAWQDIKLPKSDLDEINIESIQAVCNYLTPHWVDLFLKHLQKSRKDVLEPSQSQAQKPSFTTPPPSASSAGIAADTAFSPAKSPPKKQASARTANNKRLDKVNKKGMKSIASFFGAPKAKKPKTK